MLFLQCCSISIHSYVKKHGVNIRLKLCFFMYNVYLKKKQQDNCHTLLFLDSEVSKKSSHWESGRNTERINTRNV
jgi:hypothetical protein